MGHIHNTFKLIAGLLHKNLTMFVNILSYIDFGPVFKQFHRKITISIKIKRVKFQKVSYANILCLIFIWVTFITLLN